MNDHDEFLKALLAERIDLPHIVSIEMLAKLIRQGHLVEKVAERKVDRPYEEFRFYTSKCNLVIGQNLHVGFNGDVTAAINLISCIALLNYP